MYKDAIIRVQFQRGVATGFEPGYWNYEPENALSWTAKDGTKQID